MQSVYHTIKPDPLHVAIFKKIAVEMGELIKTYFNFTRWPNYLHKLIEHVQEIQEDPSGLGSIEAFSGEGNEAGNKIFRLFRKNFANKGNSYKGLENVLKLHWLYSSAALSQLNLQKLNTEKINVQHVENMATAKEAAGLNSSPLFFLHCIAFKTSYLVVSSCTQTELKVNFLCLKLF